MMDGITPFAFGTTPNFDSVFVQNFIGGSAGGPLHLAADPVAPKDAVTKEYVDVLATEFIPSVVPSPPASPVNGQLWYNSADGQLYIWYIDPNSSQWVIANNTGVQEAPVGTLAYGRMNKAWVPVLPLSGGTMTGPLVLHNDPTIYFMAATKGYVDVMLRNYLPLTGGTVSGQLLLTQDPVVAHGAATKQYVDSHAGIVTISDSAPSNPVPGQLWFDSIGVQMYIWYVDGAGTWVQANSPAFTEGSAGGGGGGGNFPEAPATGLIYGRDGAMQAWDPVLPLLGGQMAGPLMLQNSSPTQDNQAASKRYVDTAVSSGSLWQGNYIVATNTPNLANVTPLQNGYTWTAITQDPNVPENLIINLPGIPVGTLIDNGDTLRYNGVDNLWFQLKGSSLTRVEADSLYVALRGSTMIGELYLASSPFEDTMAADKQYVDANRVIVSSTPPNTPFEGQLWYDLAEPNLYVWVVDPTSAQWVIAVNPGAAAPPAARVLVDFNFPPNPADGEIVTTPGGASYRWDAANDRWDYVPLVGSYVNISGDTMTGDLFVTNPTDGSGVIRISGSDQQSMRIRFRKNNAAQWMLDSNETHFRLLSYVPDGATGREIWSVGLADTMFIRHPQTDNVATGDSDVVNLASLNTGLDTKVNRSGDTMTGQLRLTNGNIEIDHPANALIRLIGPEASAISFKRNPAVNDPQWVMGVNRTLSGSMAQDSFSFVRFPTGDPNTFDIPLEINYSNGDVFVDRIRARRPDPIWPDELATRQYVDARFAGESLFIGLLDASTGLVLTVPGHGPPPSGPIPAPDAVPLGAYYICNVAGVIPPNSAQVPNATFYVGDWLITAGTVWTRIGLGATSGTATNVQVIPDVFGENNVQSSLQAAETQMNLRVRLTGDTMIGPLTSPAFICNANGGGYQTFDGGVFYKATGTRGLVLRSPISNAQPQIEDNNGANPRDILDSVIGMPKSGGAFTGGISFGSVAQINALDISRHIALWGAGTTGFGFSVTSGRLNVVAANAATNRIGFIVGPTGGVVGEFSSTGLELPGAPTLISHATNKLYVDSAITAAPRVWTTGQAYAAGSTVMFAGLPFTVITAIANAPATPDFTTIRLSGGNQGDYWQGVPTGWTTDSWLHIATMPAGGTYRMHIDCMEVSHTGVYMLDIATTYTKGNITVTTYAPYGNGIFKAFRLSASGSNWNPVRLEAQFAAPATSGQSLKLILTGFSNENSNLVSIPKPPAGQAANLGGTEYQLLAVNPGTGGNAADPSFLTRAIQTGTGGWIRFPHANATSKDDGRISARLHSRGLNIVGSATEAGDTMRYISIYGDVEVTGTNKIVARTFQARDDNFGFQTFGDGWFYKRSGSGLTLRKTSGGQQPRIEENNGSNGRDIIDTLNGDARYSPRNSRVYAAARFPRVRSEGADAGIGNNPPTLRANSNSIHTSNANYPTGGIVFLPPLDYLTAGLPFFYENDAQFQLDVQIARTSMESVLIVTQGNTAVFIKNGFTNLYDYVGTIANNQLPRANQVNMLGNFYTLPGTRGTNGQALISDGAGGTLWGSGAAPVGPWQNILITLGNWPSVAAPLRCRWVGSATSAIEIEGRINSPTDYNGNFTNVATLPVGLRPTATQLQYSISCYANGSATYGTARLVITANSGFLNFQPAVPAGLVGNIDFYVSGIIAPLN